MSTQKILVLGSGMVASPCIDYLARKPSNSITIASRTLPSAQNLSSRFPGTSAIQLDVAAIDAHNTKLLDEKIAAHDLVISLVPFVHHPRIIESAIKGKTNVVTTSYVSTAIRALEDRAKAAGIVVLNEVGVDPGFDHCYTIKTITEVHAKGGKIKEFHSYCGGLPLPTPSLLTSNPLRFKFSWSPRGALLSQHNSATFLSQSEVKSISRDELMAHAEPYFVKDGYEFLAYPNRDSVPFREAYGIPEAETVVRGSLRYEGNPGFVRALIRLGWLDTEEKEWLKSKEGGGLKWVEILGRMLEVKGGEEESLIARIDGRCAFRSQAEREHVLSGLRWIGMFSTDLAPVQKTLVDTLAAQLAKLCSFESGEQDLVMLQHKFVIEWENGKQETRTSTLELLGSSYPDGYSAMARSVGTTCGIATQLLLDGEMKAFQRPGVLAPYQEEICRPIREGLEREGLTMVEERVA